MPQVVFSANAVANLSELVAFLKEKSPEASERAIARIRQSLALLRHQPQIGTPVAERAHHRNLPISFGSAGYVARYHFQPGTDRVVVLAIRHMKQAGFSGLEP